MDLGIVGGTGPAGKALAIRLAASGVRVLIGSRSSERAAQTAAELAAAWPARSLDLVGVANEQAAGASIVVLATPWEGAVETAVGLAETLEGKVLVSMVNALARVGREFQALVPARGSIAATLQAALPRVEVTTAFQHVPAGPLADLNQVVHCDVLVCADTRAAASKTIELVEQIEGLRGVRAGSLASANAVEALTAVLINVNIAYKTHVALSLTGHDGGFGA